MKYCYVCKQYKKRIFFYKNRACYDGLESRCMFCSKKRNKSMRIKNPDYFKKKHIEFLERNPNYYKNRL